MPTFGASGVGRPHPVRILPAQLATPKACIECHKTTIGKFIHSAIEAAGCGACHEVRTEGEKTTVQLLATGNALCLTCHEEKAGKGAAGQQHFPVVEGECTACHNPHASANKFLLLQPASGGKDENLCLACHDTGADVPVKGSRHGALDLGCDTCHVTHKTGDGSQPEFRYHLTEAVPALCRNCHDTADKAMMEAHGGQPLAQSNCVACHNPHASRRPKLTHANAHPPFAEKQCDACHEPPKDGKVVLIEGGKRALCLLCHDSIQNQLNAAKRVHKAISMSDTCTGCHSPHATPYPLHLVQSPVTLCVSCHPQRARERTSKQFVHAPVFQAGCTVCHEPHAGNFAGNLRAQVDEVCLTCHARNAQGEPSADSNSLVLFKGAVRLPANYLESVRRIPLRQGATTGHPLATHPVSGVADPSNPGKTITCVSCHNPHAGNGSPRLFVTETRSSSPLCIRCHK
ncbi:MAG: hypothetical protein HY234_06415 [Acidobacteria bacterium]|nr:hypothetical protein [Acidobacteriota bacterium]MBI3662667.1 hypothetical protein [Acidobacteriota bacterium]